MNRSWFRTLTTLVVGIAAALAIASSNVGCRGKCCGAGCDKPCCKKCPAGCTKPCCKKAEEPKKP